MSHPRPHADHLPFDERREPSTRAAAGASASPAHNESAPASRDARIFRDTEGMTWWVHEVTGEHLGTVGATCLLVVSANDLRRIWKFPPDWRQLPAADLLALPQQGPSSRAASR